MGLFKASGIRPKCAEQLATAGYPLPMDMFEHQHRIGGQPESDEWGKRR
jgi:hypothetical protein